MEWAGIYKSEYLLGTLLSNVTSEVLIPVSMSISIAVSILCNFALVRATGFVFRLTILNVSIMSFAVVFLVLYIGSKIYNVRRAGLKRKLSLTKSKLGRKVLEGCRVQRLNYGPFYKIDHKLILIITSFIVSRTARLLIVLH
jgi:hypothetical protein